MIIIPDVHGRDFWEKPVKECLGKEHIIFLGDYLDPYDYEGITTMEAFQRFEDILAIKRENPDSVRLLLGNHDLHYVNGNLLGGRYDFLHGARNKRAVVDNADLFQLAYETEISGKKYLFTHAGVLNGWIGKNRPLLGDVKPEEIGQRLNEYWSNRGYWQELFTILGDIPFTRWGSCKWGSPVWSDVIDMDDSDYEIPDTYQIFGHSQQEEDPVIGDYFACLDCRCPFHLDNQGIKPYYN